MSRKHFGYNIITAISMITQLGLSILVPIALCIFIAGWLRNKFNLGIWIVIVGILTGVGSGICSMIKYINIIRKKIENDDEE